MIQFENAHDLTLFVTEYFPSSRFDVQKEAEENDWMISSWELDSLAVERAVAQWDEDTEEL